MAGEWYDVRFALAFSQSCGIFYGFPACDEYSVSVGGEGISRRGSTAFYPRRDWYFQKFSFQAFGEFAQLSVFAYSPFGSHSFDSFVVSLSSAGIPEPSTWLLMGSAFGLLGGVMRYKRLRADGGL